MLCHHTEQTQSKTVSPEKTDANAFGCLI